MLMAWLATSRPEPPVTPFRRSVPVPETLAVTRYHVGPIRVTVATAPEAVPVAVNQKSLAATVVMV